MYRDIPEDMKRLVEPVVESSGLELVDLQLVKGRKPWSLRIIVDTPAGDGRVTVDRCAEVSREIETSLDAADAIPSAYHLEVSSPGLDRVLAREKDFRAACGTEVQVRTRQPIDGRRRFRGRLVDFDGSVAKLSVDGVEWDVPFDDVERAHVVYEFTRADFATPTQSRKAG